MGENDIGFTLFTTLLHGNVLLLRLVLSHLRKLFALVCNNFQLFFVGVRTDESVMGENMRALAIATASGSGSGSGSGKI